MTVKYQMKNRTTDADVGGLLDTLPPELVGNMGPNDIGLANLDWTGLDHFMGMAIVKIDIPDDVPAPIQFIVKSALLDRFTDEQERLWKANCAVARNLTVEQLADTDFENYYQLSRFLERFDPATQIKIDAPILTEGFETLRLLGVFGDPESEDSTNAKDYMLRPPVGSEGSSGQTQIAYSAGTTTAYNPWQISKYWLLNRFSLAERTRWLELVAICKNMTPEEIATEGNPYVLLGIFLQSFDALDVIELNVEDTIEAFGLLWYMELWGPISDPASATKRDYALRLPSASERPKLIGS